MPATTSETLHVDQAPTRVFDLLTDPVDLAAWTAAFDEAERLDDGPLRTGSRIRVAARVDGRPATIDLEVREIDPPSELVLVGRNDDVTTVATLSVDPADGGGSDVTATTLARVDDADEGVEPAANPAFADLGATLLHGVAAACGAELPQEPRS